MKTAILVSIREKSTRFPGKVLKEFHGQSVTEHLIDRVKSVGNADKVIIATSDDPRDQVFSEMAIKKNIDIYYGSQEDKLLRYLQIAREYSMDAVVIVDGDDILCFPEVISKTIDVLSQGKYDVVFWNKLPLGAASSGLTVKALERVIELKDEIDTEVWGGYFTDGNFSVLRNDITEPLFQHPEIRLTLDYKEDYDFFEKIFDRLYTSDKIFSSIELMNLLVNVEPKLNIINQEAQIKYESHLKKAKPVKFKE
ncbi:hypothetical protein MASR2M39_30500 [Ignavibacteriales bacterium]